MMARIVAEELRALAEQCVAFARDCKGCELSSVLEELGVDLMLKAAAIEQRFDR